MRLNTPSLFNLQVQVKMTSKRSSSKQLARRPYKRAKSVRVSRFAEVLRPFRCKLLYTDGVLLATSAGVGFTTYSFRANSLFDPDYTGTGHQPYRYDQLATIYQKYRVVSSKITVNFSTGDKTVAATDTGPWQVGVVPSTAFTSTGSGTDMYTLAESAMSSFGVLRNGITKTCSTTWKPGDMTDISPRDDTFQALTSANPSTQIAYIVWLWNQGSTAATNVIANVTIEFECEFSRPLQTTSS